MNSDSSDKVNLPGEAPRPAVDLNVSDRSQRPEVPVFNCLVYVSKDAAGEVRARVANLPGIAAAAASEREALGKIVSAFKQQIGELLRSETKIPWMDPPSTPEPGEQSRRIAVHL
jgi:predicted RNase H-like HicB family nuclease